MQTCPLPHSVSAVQALFGLNWQVPLSHFSPNGQLEVLEVNATQVRFSYGFEMPDMSYGGTATVMLCDNQPLCG